MEQELITVKEAARLLGLADKTVHNRGGGTKTLTRVYVGTAVRLLRPEVIALRDDFISRAAHVASLKRAA